MADGDGATADRPARRRESWSLRTIVENVSGRPIDDFQDPDRPVHPYLAQRVTRLPPAARPRPTEPGAGPDAETDPVDRVIPPLAGATGRGLHGADHEHHPATLRSVEGPAEPLGPGDRPHAPGPSRRPERVYLHYLLLHMDRLSDASLRYLKSAVDEEVAHRQAPASRPPGSTPRPDA